MTASVPGVIAWPVIAWMLITLAARYRWCRTNLYDTYYTNLMALLMLAQLLREHAVEVALSRSALMTVTTAQQLSLAAVALACTEFIGFTMLWAGRSEAETRRVHRYYRAAAVVLCLAFLVAATRARIAGQLLEVAGGWDTILASSFYLAMIFVLAGRATWMFAAELRKSSQNREFLLASGGLVLAIVTAAGCLEALVLPITDQLGWTNTLKFRLWLHGAEFFYVAVFAFIFGAVPLVTKLLCYLGIDPTSRAWKRLEPLRLSLIAAVPEGRFGVEQDGRRFQKTTLELHQTVIEIRDAILQLRPYFRDSTPHQPSWLREVNSAPARERDAATYAFELAHAVKAKTAGVTPGPTGTATIMRSRSTTLDEEVAELLALAKWWHPARAAVEQFNPGPINRSRRPRPSGAPPIPAADDPQALCSGK